MPESPINNANVCLVYLDAVSLATNYSLTQLRHPCFEFWITPSVKKVIDDPDSAAFVAHERVHEALRGRRIKYNPVDLTDCGFTPDVYGPYADVLSHAVSNMKEQQVLVVTDDSHMRKHAEELGVPVTDAAGIHKLVDEATKADADAKAAAEERELRARRDFHRRILTQAALGLLVALTGNLVAHYARIIIDTISVWGTIVALALGGALLYGFRGRRRFAYGFAEVCVGVGGAAYILLDGLELRSINIDLGFKLAAALYVIVRGLDNIGKALEGTSYDRGWRRFSGEPEKK